MRTQRGFNLRGCGCSIIILAIIGVIVAGVLIVAAINLKQAQDATVKAYGQPVIDLCSNLSAPTVSSELPAGSKVAFLNADDKIVLDQYQKAAAADKVAADKSTLTHVVCIKKTQDVFHTDVYGSSSKYSCVQYQVSADAYVVDVKTGTVLKSSKIKGPTPPDCPDKTDKNLTETGDLPDSTTFLAWVFNQ